LRKTQSEVAQKLLQKVSCYLIWFSVKKIYCRKSRANQRNKVYDYRKIKQTILAYIAAFETKKPIKIT
jgi:hypothetical protein